MHTRYACSFFATTSYKFAGRSELQLKDSGRSLLANPLISLNEGIKNAHVVLLNYERSKYKCYSLYRVSLWCFWCYLILPRCSIQITPDGTVTNQGRVRDPLSWRDYEYALRLISTLQQPPNPPQSRRRRRPEYLPQSHVSQAQLSPGGTPYMYGGPYRSAPTYPLLVQQQRLDRSPCHVTMGPHAGQYIMQAPFSGIPVARGAIPCIPNVALNGVVNQTTVASAARARAISQDQEEVVPAVSQGVVEATSPSQQSLYDFGECPAWLTDLLEGDDEKTVSSEATDELPLPDPNAIEELLALMDEVKSPATDSLIAPACETNHISIQAGEVDNTAAHPNNTYKFSIADCSTLEELLAPADEVSTVVEPVDSQQDFKAEPDETPLPDPSTMRELLALADEVSTAAEGSTVPVGSQQVSDAAQEEAPLPNPSTMQEILSLVGEVTSAVESSDSSCNASCVEYIEEVIEEGTVPSFTTPTVYQSPTGTAQVWFSPYTCTYMNMSAELASVFSSSVAPWPLSSTSVPEVTSRKRRRSQKINEEKTKRRRTGDKWGVPR
ncbi:predicted protein [Nematostella vectensis]|uniref:Uncharacterized protein n=1 Tax=Nematostella vectensis TaxID=45351 RepID=A7SXV3_NEMVE|nr:predicted protein [Nematostella vectensis]|eukprot:XP_001623559.1 predicted protein [Nematostella vectensis]